MNRNHHELVTRRGRKRNKQGNYPKHVRCKCGQWNFTPNEQASQSGEENRMWQEFEFHQAQSGTFR